ncbi:MAG: ATP-binding cassette domain-containing protein [Streptosporangiaceae bacterium]|jgi:branched-chain amino acid transport system ATP-binding protein
MPIVIESLCAGYGSRTVLFDVDAAVRSGEILGIFGHNGAGKTTLLRALAGSLPVSSGAVRVTSGDEMAERPVIRLVPQEEMVFEHLSVRENLMVGLWNDKKAWRSADQRIAAVCELLPTVGRILDRRGGALSGGERRQVALARALLPEPDVLLVDEPSLGLSPVATDIVMGKLSELHASGTTVVIVEQNLPVALALVERYYVLRQGRITHETEVVPGQQTSLEQLYELI